MIWILFFSYFVLGEPQATVWARDPAAVRDYFPSENYQMLDGETEAKEFAAQGYLMPRVRDAMFIKLKLDDYVKNLDELDKDILVMDARFTALAELKKHYPKLKEKQLVELQLEVKRLTGQ